MSRAVSPSTNRPYGVAAVSRLWGVARATVYRRRRPAAGPRRPGPIGPMPDDELVAAIRDLLAESPFHGEATARSGPDCGSPASALPSAASCA